MFHCPCAPDSPSCIKFQKPFIPPRSLAAHFVTVSPPLNASSTHSTLFCFSVFDKQRVSITSHLPLVLALLSFISIGLRPSFFLSCHQQIILSNEIDLHTPKETFRYGFSCLRSHNIVTALTRLPAIYLKGKSIQKMPMA